MSGRRFRATRERGCAVGPQVVVAGLVVAMWLAGSALEPPAAAASTTLCPTTYVRLVEVSTAAGLVAALRDSRPGDLIHLADGRYAGHFVADISGVPGNRIWLCGSRLAILDGGSLTTGYGFHLRASYWTLAGFSVTKAYKGIVLDRASHNVLRSLAVRRIGQEGVHLRTFSTSNTIERSVIRDTGLVSPADGEGIYIGSAATNWCRYTNCLPDASDFNRVLDNRIGPNTTAEGVDIKEGTSGGIVSGNTFSGIGMTAADSWVDVKGNGYTISGNAGTDSPLDGFQTHVVVAGWGNDNVFLANTADVSGSGYGFRIGRGTTDNRVGCDNTVLNAGSGFANVPCR